MDLTRRSLITAAAALLVDQYTAPSLAVGLAAAPRSSRKVVVVTCGGVRQEDTFQQNGARNIPHLYRDLLPKSIFFPKLHNDGVTSHFNTISSILTGNWQRVDDWGKDPPANPTIFEYLRKQTVMGPRDTWFVSSNKALTSRIGASVAPGYGPQYGANVIFPKQLLITAVVQAASQGRATHTVDRLAMQQEIQAIVAANNFEGIGWSASDSAPALDSSAQASVMQAIEDLVRTNAPVTGDEFTFLVSTEIMRRFAPSLMVITFSDAEAAHFGSYSLYLAGIRTFDHLISELWEQVQAIPQYKETTTMFVLPEFGRDLDGSNTNGFFNHRQDSESTRVTWMLCLGDAVGHPRIVERPIQHIDLCPTIGHLLDIDTPDASGKALAEICG